MNACRHHELEPRSVCPSCGAWVSAMDVCVAMQKRMEERLKALDGGWSIERDAMGKPVRMFWHSPRANA